MSSLRLVASSHRGPGFVPIIIGGLILILVSLARVLPEDSPVSKVLAGLLTRFGHYDLTPARLTVVVIVSLALVGVGVALVITGH